MQFNKTIFTSIMLALITIFSVIAFTSNEISAPSAYVTLTSTSVNISGAVNASAFSGLSQGDVVNVTILNKSSNGGDYGILESSLLSRINASGTSKHVFWNQTVTLARDTRHWIILNFTNATSGGSLSSERIIDIDIDFFTIQVGQFGTINLSVDTGNINVSGIVKSRALVLENSTQVLDDCDSGRAGELLFNGTGTSLNVPSLIFCNGDTWRLFNLTG